MFSYVLRSIKPRLPSSYCRVRNILKSASLHINYRAPIESCSVKKDYIAKLPELYQNTKFVRNMSQEGIPTVTYEYVKTLKNENNVLLIDVREPLELKESGTLPGSINIPLSQVENALKSTSPEEFLKTYERPKPAQNFALVFSCRSGKRSTTAAQTAIKLGYTNVQNYTGGWLNWEEKTKQQ